MLTYIGVLLVFAIVFCHLNEGLYKENADKTVRIPVALLFSGFASVVAGIVIHHNGILGLIGILFVFLVVKFSEKRIREKNL